MLVIITHAHIIRGLWRHKKMFIQENGGLLNPTQATHWDTILVALHWRESDSFRSCISPAAFVDTE